MFLVMIWMEGRKEEREEERGKGTGQHGKIREITS